MIPRIVERSIIRLKTPGGLMRYMLTIPKEYAERLDAEGVRKLLIVYNHGLGAFPSEGAESEAAILAFLKAHPDLKRALTLEAEEAEG